MGRLAREHVALESEGAIDDRERHGFGVVGDRGVLGVEGASLEDVGDVWV